MSDPHPVGVVRVILLPTGEFTGSSYHIDEFTAGELTVTSLVDDSIVRVFPPGSWASAVVYDAQMHPVYWFHALPPVKSEREVA